MKKLLIIGIFTLGGASVSFAGTGNANCAHAKKNEAQKRAARKQARLIAQEGRLSNSSKPAKNVR